MTLNDLTILAVAALLGVTGQGVRVIVGMKKLSDIASQQNTKVKDLIEPSSLLISLLIGLIAGVLAGVMDISFANDSQLSKSLLFSFLGAGYAGADFIEGFMHKAVPDLNTMNTTNVDPPFGGSDQPS